MTQTADFTITVRRLGVDEIVYREQFTGTQHQAERRASDIWMPQRLPPDFATYPERFRLKLFRKGERKPVLTIG
jgi:hypothetical protein